MLRRDAWAAVWYRHWLEHAGAAIVALGVVVLLGAGFVVAVSIVGRDPLAAHVYGAAVAAWGLPLLVHGTGIRTNDLLPGHASLQYTLTLPVPRSRLVCTRFAVACASGALLQASLLAFDTLAVALLGLPVPFAAMATAAVPGTAVLAAVVAVLGVINAWDDRQAQWLVMAVTGGLLLGGFSRTTDLLGGGGVPWLGVGLMGALSVAALALTTLIARVRDF